MGLSFFEDAYLPRRHLQHLDNYKYHGVDHSILSRLVYKRFWNWVVEFIPKWVAYPSCVLMYLCPGSPNVITLMGFLLSFGIYALLMLYTPMMDKAAPSWVYIYMGLASFTYIHLDALDGKQARRTGTSSPLGQLFDHGCDCMNLIFMILMFWSNFGYSHGPLMPLYSILCYAVFVSSTWEEFHTGLLKLDAFNGPVEGTTILSVCSLLSGIYGRDIWQNAMPVLGISYAQFLLYVVQVSSVVTVLGSIVRVIRKCGLAPLTDLSFSFGFLYAAVWLPTQHHELVSKEVLTSYVVFLGFVTSNLVSRMVVRSITAQTYPRVTRAHVPIIVLVLKSFASAYYPAIDEAFSHQKAVAIALAYVVVVQAHYHYVIFTRVARYLGIRIFSITPRDHSRPFSRRSEKAPIKKVAEALKRSSALTAEVRQSPRLKNRQIYQYGTN